MGNDIDAVGPLRKFLACQEDIGSYIDTDSKWDIYIFQESLPIRMESTQKIALVLRQEGFWTSPNTYNTMRFPRLITEFWCDPPRDAAANVVNWVSAKRQIQKTHAYIDLFLHSVTSEAVWWPSFTDPQRFRVISSKRQGELEYFPVSDGNGLLRATCSYALTTG